MSVDQPVAAEKIIAARQIVDVALVAIHAVHRACGRVGHRKASRGFDVEVEAAVDRRAILVVDLGRFGGVVGPLVQDGAARRGRAECFPRLRCGR